MRYDVDLFVIGAGSGGVRAARVAAAHGARVAIAEADRVGGTCVIRGCVPKKLMVVASRYGDAFDSAVGYGWERERLRFDWTKLAGRTQQEVGRLEGLYRSMLERSGARLLSGRAVLADANTIALGPSRTRITAANILISTGGRPALPDLPGAGHLLSSDDFFVLPALPARACVLGGGYIAVELAGLLRGLGSEVVLVHRGATLLRGFDPDLAQELTRAYRERGIDVALGVSATRIERDGATTRVHLSDGRVLGCDAAFAATGRLPASAGLGLDEVGVRTDALGAIVVDKDSRTTVPGIYAVGDVTNRINLTPVAVREGHALADLLFGQTYSGVDHGDVATAVFSTPEIGTVGPSEQVARSMYPALRVFRSSFRPLASALSDRPDRMTMKLLVDGQTDRLVGAHLIGPESAELVQLLAVAVRAGLTKSQLDATVAVHPTMAEELVTMRQEVRTDPNAATA
jgi:glutathione reductase (NADPH)